MMTSTCAPSRAYCARHGGKRRFETDANAEPMRAETASSCALPPARISARAHGEIFLHEGAQWDEFAERHQVHFIIACRMRAARRRANTRNCAGMKLCVCGSKSHAGAPISRWLLRAPGEFHNRRSAGCSGNAVSGQIIRRGSWSAVRPCRRNAASACVGEIQQRLQALLSL